jgi:uncharacterized membrane protein
MKFNLNNPRTLSMTAIMTGLVLALTRAAFIPNGVGYNHLGDVAVYFAAFAFGPWVGLIAGGVGTALADITTGQYAAFAPLSLIVHGLQGFAAGWIYYKRPNITGMTLGWFVGAVILVAGYFLGEYFSLIWGGPAQALIEWPTNILQALIGALGGVVYIAVLRAYPRLGRAE